MTQDTWTIIGTIATSLSAVIAAIAIHQTVKLHKQQVQIEKKQYLLPLWSQFQNLNDIDPKDPVWVDVISAANMLEIIAVSWENNLLDESIILRIYKQLYIDFYDKIIKCVTDKPENVPLNGQQMIFSSQSTKNLYQRVKYGPVDGESLSKFRRILKIIKEKKNEDTSLNSIKRP